jgi:hypothetical protein
MVHLKVTSILMQSAGAILIISALYLGMEARHQDRLPAAVFAAGLAVAGGLCLVSCAILAAAQPFVGKTR